MIDPDLAYTYVLARVDLANKIVIISQDGKPLKTYDYSADTVGAWAADNEDAVVKDDICNADSSTSEHWARMSWSSWQVTPKP